MSISLNLVIYQREDDELIEEGLRTARCAEIAASLLNAIREKFPSLKCRVYYDSAKEEFFEIEYFARSDIPKVISMLQGLFEDLIEYEYSLRNFGASKKCERLKKSDLILSDILSDQEALDPTLIAIGRFRNLISVFDAFSEMQTKFIDEPGAVLKLG
ncbi:hypothetical protein [Pseudomonas putida]|uniref:hypothetical protein n=1 Tax=Pseudomonas putida TaxID=303 RepID=UPI000646D813|nr:hypothetical protein [Pseudomonas putida]